VRSLPLLPWRRNVAADSVAERAGAERDRNRSVAATRERPTAHAAHARIFHRRTFAGVPLLLFLLLCFISIVHAAKLMMMMMMMINMALGLRQPETVYNMQ